MTAKLLSERERVLRRSTQPIQGRNSTSVAVLECRVLRDNRPLNTTGNQVGDADSKVSRSPSSLRTLCRRASGACHSQGVDWPESETTISARLSLEPASAQHAPAMVEILADPSLAE